MSRGRWQMDFTLKRQSEWPERCLREQTFGWILTSLVQQSEPAQGPKHMDVDERFQIRVLAVTAHQSGAESFIRYA